MKPLSQASARYIILMVAGGYIVVLGLVEGARGVGALDYADGGRGSAADHDGRQLERWRRAWLLHSLPPASKLTDFLVSLHIVQNCVEKLFADLRIPRK